MVTRQGFVYDTVSRSTPGDISPESSNYTNVVNDGALANGTFSELVTGLTSNTTYYYRSFGYDDVTDTYIYGDEVSFTTLENTIVTIKDTNYLVAGKVGEGFRFNSDLTANQVEIEGLSSIFQQTGTYSVALWIKQYNTGTNMNVWNYNGGGSNRHNLNINGGTVGFNLYNGSSYNRVKYDSGVELETWVHIVCVNDGGSLKIYKNSVDLGIPGGTYAVSYTGSKFVLGFPNNATNGSQSVDADLDDVRIFKYALSSEEVSKIYNEGNVTELYSNDSETKETVRVIHKNNKFNEHFAHTDFIDETTSTGSITNEQYTLDSGEILQSNIIYKNNENVTSARVEIFSDDDISNLSIELSFDNGYSWVSATNNSFKVNSNTVASSDVKYKITNGGSSVDLDKVEVTINI